MENYITVKELMEALKQFPEDAVVFMYNGLDEGDGNIEQVELESPYFEDGEFYTPNYCQGDSFVEEYWREYGSNKPVVFLKSQC